ncbi:MAG: hypothetical protein ACRECR_07300, partial [Thermoplasmata archaeon]
MLRSVLNLSLEYDDGHDLVAVPPAMNFGSGTAETASNAVVRAGPTGSGGTPNATVSAGPGELEPLWGPTEDGLLNGSTPFASGGYDVNGVPTGSFRLGGVNLTVVPGSYTIGLDPNGSVPAEEFLFERASFPIRFEASGLPLERALDHQVRRGQLERRLHRDDRDLPDERELRLLDPGGRRARGRARERHRSGRRGPGHH